MNRPEILIAFRVRPPRDATLKELGYLLSMFRCLLQLRGWKLMKDGADFFPEPHSDIALPGA